MSRISYQILRDGAAKWVIWRVTDRQDYEQIARVVQEDGLYYVELPQWGSDGISKWDRQPRGWALRDGAVASVTREKKAMAS